MPPLRERKEDILPLAGWFIRRFSSELKKKLDGLDTEAQKMLMRYNWPGNIRELENAIERAALLAEGADDPRGRSAARRSSANGAARRRRSPSRSRRPASRSKRSSGRR